MEEFLTSLPTSPIGWIGLTLAAIAAGFTAYLFWSRQRDGADDRLIGILKQTVDELEKKVNKQDEDIKSLVGKVDRLKYINETLTKVLQGRDEATLAFQRELLNSASTAKETNQIAQNLEKSIGRLTDLLSAHMIAMETFKDDPKRGGLLNGGSK